MAGWMKRRGPTKDFNWCPGLKLSESFDRAMLPHMCIRMHMRLHIYMYS